MWYLKLLEKNLVPHFLIRWGIRTLSGKRLALEEAHRQTTSVIAKKLSESPIAVQTPAANEQHYEVPTEFFRYCLGPHMKYSSCYWPQGVKTLEKSEEAMLALTAQRAQLQNGQNILELGCGWGSLTLYMASQFPESRITGVSNSRTQKIYIDAEAQRRGLNNVRIITADMNHFEISETFDRIVSVEMFEHMRNYDKLFKKVASWMKSDALLFIHIFAHSRFAYLFEADGDHDWMARYFFTGGIMPSVDLFTHFQQDVKLMEQWIVDGTHYEKTSNAWLKNMDKHRREIMPIFKNVYGEADALKWWVYWRIFYMSVAELFGYKHGHEWVIAHYLFGKK